MKSRFPNIWFTIIFVGIVSLELLSEWNGHQLLHYLSKPSIMLALLVFVLLERRIIAHPARGWLLSGMIFGLFGDVWLMFKDEISSALQLGLGSFLCGHIAYIVAYRKHLSQKSTKPAWNLQFTWVALAVIYAISLLLVLYRYVGTMLAPICVYSVALLGMTLFAKERQTRVSVQSFRWVWIGALCFVFSDSILALYIFVYPHPALAVLLMTLYSVAQYGICVGMLLQMREELT
jgi:uncharacterized membrane protein YhhN